MLGATGGVRAATHRRLNPWRIPFSDRAASAMAQIKEIAEIERGRLSAGMYAPTSRLVAAWHTSSGARTWRSSANRRSLSGRTVAQCAWPDRGVARSSCYDAAPAVGPLIRMCLCNRGSRVSTLVSTRCGVGSSSATPGGMLGHAPQTGGRGSRCLGRCAGAPTCTHTAVQAPPEVLPFLPYLAQQYTNML